MKILIMPGLDGTGKLHGELKALLEPHCDVVVLEYPPHLSRYEDLQDWVVRALPSDAFIMVAESFSGPLALMIAAHRPQGLKGIVAVATFAKAPRRLPACLASGVRVLPIGSKALATLAQPLLMGSWSNKAFTRAFRTAVSAVPAATISGRLKEVLAVDVREKIAEISVPIIYLQARNDRIVPSKMSVDFARAGGEVHNVEGPHFLLQANPTASAKRILEFVSRVI